MTQDLPPATQCKDSPQRLFIPSKSQFLLAMLDSFSNQNTSFAVVLFFPAISSRCCCFSVTQLCLFFTTTWTAECQASPSLFISQSLLKPMPIFSNPCHPTISSSAARYSSGPQSRPESGSCPMNWLFASGGQSTGASVSVLPMNIQGWFPLGWTGLFSYCPRDSQ